MDKNSSKQISQMPVVILAGGRGVPLGQDNTLIPKPMIDINGLPLLFYIMDHYTRFGFKKFIICGGYGFKMIAESLKSIEREWNVSVIDTGTENMTGSRIAQVAHLVSAAPFFCLTYGDTVSDINLDDLISFHLKHKKTASLLAVHAPIRFKILGLYGDDDVVRGFANRPILQKDYINGGFYILNNSIFNFKTLKKSADCTLENEVLEELSVQKELCAFRYEGFWQHVDTERDRQLLSAKLRGNSG